MGKGIFFSPKAKANLQLEGGCFLVTNQRSQGKTLWMTSIFLGIMILVTSCSFFKENYPIPEDRLFGTWIHQDSKGNKTTMNLNEDMSIEITNVPREVIPDYAPLFSVDELDWTDTLNASGSWSSGFNESANHSYISADFIDLIALFKLYTEEDGSKISIYIPIGDPDSGVFFRFTRAANQASSG